MPSGIRLHDPNAEINRFSGMVLPEILAINGVNLTGIRYYSTNIFCWDPPFCQQPQLAMRYSICPFPESLLRKIKEIFAIYFIKF